MVAYLYLPNGKNMSNKFKLYFRDGSPREVFFERGTDNKNNIKVVGSLNSETWLKRNESIRRVHSIEGVAPTTPTGQEGGVMTKIAITRGRSTEPWSEVAPSRRLSDKDDIKIIVKEATKQGYAIAEEGDSINLSVPNSKTRRGRVGKGIAQTLDTGMHQHTLTDCRIRRLTPIECERLMGLPDGWTARGVMSGKEVEISDSQRYKLCGNGVVVNVVEEIIKNIICL